MEKYITLAVKTRNNQRRWYSRITISPALAATANFSPGMRINVARGANSIKITRDSCGNLAFPDLKGKQNQYYPLEIAVDKLNIAHTEHQQEPMDFQVSDGSITLTAPKSYFLKKSEVIVNPKPKRDYVSIHKRREQAILLFGHLGHGVGATIALEGLNIGIKVRPVGIEQIITYFQNQGYQMVQLNQRHYLMNDVTINVANLAEQYSRLIGANYRNPIVLVMDEIC